MSKLTNKYSFIPSQYCCYRYYHIIPTVKKHMKILFFYIENRFISSILM